MKRRLRTLAIMALKGSDFFRLGSYLAVLTLLLSAASLIRFDGVTSSLPFRGPRPAVQFDSLSLTEQQCTTQFPNLEVEVDTAVARGPFELSRGPDDYRGLVQGRIENGKVLNLHGLKVSTSNTRA